MYGFKEATTANKKQETSSSEAKAKANLKDWEGRLVSWKSFYDKVDQTASEQAQKLTLREEILKTLNLKEEDLDARARAHLNSTVIAYYYQIASSNWIKLEGRIPPTISDILIRLSNEKKEEEKRKQEEERRKKMEEVTKKKKEKEEEEKRKKEEEKKKKEETSSLGANSKANLKGWNGRVVSFRSFYDKVDPTASKEAQNSALRVEILKILNLKEEDLDAGARADLISNAKIICHKIAHTSLSKLEGEIPPIITSLIQLSNKKKEREKTKQFMDEIRKKMEEATKKKKEKEEEEKKKKEEEEKRKKEEQHVKDVLAKLNSQQAVKVGKQVDLKVAKKVWRRPADLRTALVDHALTDSKMLETITKLATDTISEMDQLDEFLGSHERKDLLKLQETMGIRVDSRQTVSVIQKNIKTYVIDNDIKINNVKEMMSGNMPREEDDEDMANRIKFSQIQMADLKNVDVLDLVKEHLPETADWIFKKPEVLRERLYEKVLKMIYFQLICKYVQLSA